MNHLAETRGTALHIIRDVIHSLFGQANGLARKMAQIIECVPNFSEGQRKEVIDNAYFLINVSVCAAIAF